MTISARHREPAPKERRGDPIAALLAMTISGVIASRLRRNGVAIPWRTELAQRLRRFLYAAARFGELVVPCVIEIRKYGISP
jgi:hypothetical protein